MASFDASLNPEVNEFDSSTFIKKSWPGFSNEASGEAAGVAPIVSLVSPLGGEIPNADFPVTIDVVDSDSGITAIFIWIIYRDFPIARLAYDGSVFLSEFAGSYKQTITNGTRFIVSPKLGWLGPIKSMRVRAIDATGIIDAEIM